MTVLVETKQSSDLRFQESLVILLLLKLVNIEISSSLAQKFIQIILLLSLLVMMLLIRNSLK